VPSLCEFYLGTCLTTEEKARKNPQSGCYSVCGNIPAYFCVLLHVKQEIKLQQPKNNDVFCTRPFGVLRDDDRMRFETCRSFNALM